MRGKFLNIIDAPRLLSYSFAWKTIIPKETPTHA